MISGGLSVEGRVHWHGTDYTREWWRECLAMGLHIRRKASVSRLGVQYGCGADGLAVNPFIRRID